MACATEYVKLHEPTAFELACQDLKAQCEFDEPDIVYNSSLIVSITGAMGITVYDENRIYVAPAWYIVQSGYTMKEVLYHEMIHVVLAQEAPTDRCSSERTAREMTDKRYGGDSANNGWEIGYRCVSPSQLL